MSRNQTSLSTVAAVKIERKVMSDEYVVTKPILCKHLFAGVLDVLVTHQDR